jgi:hypothetical protein
MVDHDLIKKTWAVGTRGIVRTIGAAIIYDYIAINIVWDVDAPLYAVNCTYSSNEIDTYIRPLNALDLLSEIR